MKQNIKILHITTFFHPHVGGSQRYMEELYVNLRKINPNISVDVLCYNTINSSEFEKYRGLQIYRIPCWQIIKDRFNLPKPFALLKLLLKLKNNKYQYVHTHLRFFDTTWWSWWYAKIIGAKSIFTEHVATHPTHQLMVVRSMAKLVDFTIARITVPRYDIITATNQAAANFLKSKMKVKNDITIIYGGVDTIFFSPSKTLNRKVPKLEIPVDKDAIIVTYAGRLIWTKGITFLYQAIKELLNKTQKKVYFVLAGPGELESEIKSNILKDNLSKHVILTGNLNPSQVRDLFRITDIFIYPSHHNEGLPNSLLEAGSSGCFVITTNVGGNTEIILDKKTGLIIKQKDPKDITKSLIWAISHKRERESMAKNLRKLISEKFEWSKIAKEYLKLLSI